MLCHSCEFDGKGMDVCLTCKDTCKKQYNKGRAHVSLDAESGNMSEAAKAVRNRALLSSRFDIRRYLPDCCASTAEMLIYLFTELDEHHLCVVMAVLRGESLTDYANRKRVSVAAVSQMLQRIVDGHPKLEFLREMI
jgi:hypothetical protein